ncbi:MAG: NAD(P)-dependent oxidoreductase [Rhodospirillales bacterium]|nr:NAD(P)-dependent oxidoreductase [Rhodospirillales bacterium]
MRVLVTGAGGFVGKVVARTLAAAGHQVTASYRKTRPAELAGLANVALQALDLAEMDGLDPLDAVVHCAADVPAFCPDPDALYRSNVEGACRLFDAAVAAGATRIVYLSSMSIYGTIFARVVTEDTPSTDPEVYGRSKLEGERLLAAVCARSPGLAGLSIRLPGVVGRGGRNNFLSSTLQRVLKGEPVSANHASAPFNNIVHVQDLAGFIADRLGDLPPGYRVTNIAARDSVPIRDVVARIYATAGREDGSIWGEAGKAPFTIALDRVVALGYRPPTVLDSVERFVRDEMAG